ncbi:MAG: rod shape-determining protein MreC [Anaerolineales bacterium]
MKNLFSRSVQSVILFLVVAGIIALALGGYLNFFSTGVNTALVSAQSWLSVRFLVVQEFFTLPRDSETLRTENVRLQDEVARLQAQVLQYQRQVSETQALAALVDFSRSNPDSAYTAASVIGRDPSPFLHYIIIDRGSADGIRRGMPVVTDQGLVGRVEAVISNAARVQLITDPSSVVNVRLERAERDVTLIGSVSGDLSLDLVAQDVNLEVGDILITSGLGGGYPSDLIVGQILTVRKRDSDIFQQAAVQSVVDFSALKIVLVVTDFRPVDISPLFPAP